MHTSTVAQIPNWQSSGDPGQENHGLVYGHCTWFKGELGLLAIGLSKIGLWNILNMKLVAQKNSQSVLVKADQKLNLFLCL